ncbi:MAG: hypothetical protein PHN78_01845 [Dehalococcoidales bacterium]|nr:hypothetical protein [Dehalococcoidales bacterium]
MVVVLQGTYPLPLPLKGKGVKNREGLSPSLKLFPLALVKERGIKGVR